MRTLEQLQVAPVSEWTEKEKLSFELVKAASKAKKEMLVVIFVLIGLMSNQRAAYTVYKLNHLNDEGNARTSAFCVLLSLCGYEISQAKAEKNGEPFANFVRAIHAGIEIKKEGKTLARCPLERFSLLALDVQELAEQRIKSFIREVSD